MNLLRLTRAKLSGTTVFGQLSAKTLKEKNQLWVLPIAIVGVGVAVASIVGLLYMNYRSLTVLGAVTDMPDLALYVAVIASWAFIFLLGFPIALSVLYFSRDTELLVSLPIKPFRIVLANVSVLYLYALPVALLLFIPAVVPSAALLTGSATGILADVQFYLGAVVISLLLPLVPLALSVLLVTVIGRLFNVSRYRVAFEALGMVVAIVALVALQLLLSRTLSVDPGQEVNAAMRSLAETLRGAVPPAQLFSRAFLPDGLVWLAGAAVGSFGFGALTVALVQRGFVRQITEQGSVRTRAHSGAPVDLPPVRSPMQALIRREMRLMTANSTFLFESVGELVIFPILLVIFSFSIPAEMMTELRPMITGSDLLIPALFGVLLLLAGINTMTAAGISREGKSFDLSLSIPVSGRRQAGAKLLTYLLLFGGAFVINAALAVSILRLQWWLAPLYAVGALPFLVLIGSVTLFADVRRPLLDWSHPQQAVKQNVNVLIGMGLTVVSLALVGAPAVVALLAGSGPLVALFAAVAAAIAAAAVTLRGVLRYADRRYGNAFS